MSTERSRHAVVLPEVLREFFDEENRRDSLRSSQGGVADEEDCVSWIVLCTLLDYAVKRC